MLSKTEILEQLCLIQRLVSGVIGHDYANDGFCPSCDRFIRNDFQSSGKSVEYIISAVLEKAGRENKLEKIQKVVENLSEEYLTGATGKLLKDLFL